MGKNRTLPLLICSCLAVLTACAPISAEFDLADDLVRQKQYEPAIEKYKNIISLSGQEDDHHVRANRSICEAYRQMDRHEESIPFCQRTVELDPGSESAHFNLCYSFWSLNRYQEALSSCLEGVKLSSDPARHYDNIRRLYGNLGDHATAYQYVLKWRSGKGEADIDRVLNGKDGVAENLYRLITTAGPRACGQGDLNSCVFSANVYRKKGDLEKFAELAVLACTQGSADGCISLCDHYERGQKDAEAIPYCNKAVELNPKSEFPRALLCRAWWDIGKYNEALANCLEASQLSSDPAAYYGSLWGLSLNLKDRAGAYQYVLKWNAKKGVAPIDEVLNRKDTNARLLYNLIADEGAKACRAGDLSSCLMAGRAIYLGNDRAGSWPLYSQACSLNHIESCLFLEKNGVQLSPENRERLAKYEQQKRLEEEERRRREEEQRIEQERRERRERQRRELTRRCKSRCDREFNDCMARANRQRDALAGLTQSLSCTEVFVCTSACEDLESEQDLEEVEERKQNFRQAVAGMNNSIAEGVQNYNAAVQIRKDAEQQAADQRRRQAEAQREQQQQQQNRQQQARQEQANRERERFEEKKREDERRRQEARERESARQAAREKKEREAAARAKKNPECNWMTSQVRGEKRHPTEAGSCKGEMLLYLTNNSSSNVTCEVAPVRSGSIETRWGKTANITLRPGERGGGQMGGLWWCGYGPSDTFKFVCALSTDPTACHVDVIEKAVGR